MTLTQYNPHTVARIHALTEDVVHRAVAYAQHMVLHNDTEQDIPLPGVLNCLSAVLVEGNLDFRMTIPSGVRTAYTILCSRLVHDGHWEESLASASLSEYLSLVGAVNGSFYADTGLLPADGLDITAPAIRLQQLSPLALLALLSIDPAKLSMDTGSMRVISAVEDTQEHFMYLSDYAHKNPDHDPLPVHASYAHLVSAGISPLSKVLTVSLGVPVPLAAAALSAVSTMESPSTVLDLMYYGVTSRGSVPVFDPGTLVSLLDDRSQSEHLPLTMLYAATVVDTFALNARFPRFLIEPVPVNEYIPDDVWKDSER
jgi:hypothetical protein